MHAYWHTGVLTLYLAYWDYAAIFGSSIVREINLLSSVILTHKLLPLVQKKDNLYTIR